MTKRGLHNAGWMTFLLGSVLSLAGCVDLVESEEFLPELADGNIEVGVGVNPKMVGDDEQKLGRQTAETVQKGGATWHPLQDIQLFGFQTDGGAANPDAQYLFVHPTFTEKEMAGINQTKLGGFATTPTTMYEGLNHFVGYARVNQKFNKPKDDGLVPKYFETGCSYTAWDLDPELSKNISRLRDIYFGPKAIYSGNLNNGTNKDATRLLCLLNRVLDVKAILEDGSTVMLSEISAKIHPDLFAIYANITSNEAGSFRSVRAFLEDIYNKLAKLQWQANEKQDPLNVKYLPLIEATMLRILNPVEGNPAPYTDELKLVAAEKTKATADTPPVYNLSLDPNCAPAQEEGGYNFPERLGLPDGAIVMHMLSHEEQVTLNHPVFKYVVFESEAQKSNIGLDVKRYAYPAELLYRVETPIRTATAAQSGKWKTGGTKEWTETFLSNYSADVVEAQTKSVALVEPLKYMVAGLVTKAKLAPTLTQYGGAEFPITQGGFPLKGVIVGMQGYVGWDGKSVVPPQGFPKEYYVYYDKVLNGKKLVVKGNYPTEPFSYTLVHESQYCKVEEIQPSTLTPAEIAYADEQTHQYVLLELENNEADFLGHGGQIIHKDTRFYLVAELKLSKLRNKPDFPTTPGETVSIFQQGKYVEAQLLINSVSGAYNSVPDLSNPALEISIETSFGWHNGLIFDDEIPLN